MNLIPLAEVAAIAAQVGYPRDKTTLIRRLEREGARRVEGAVAGGQLGFLYDRETLSATLRGGFRPSSPPEDTQDPAAWERYLKAPRSLKEDAEKRKDLACRVEALVREGKSKTKAREEAAAEFGVSVGTVKHVMQLVRGVHWADWLPALVKNYKPRKAADVHPDLLRYFFTDYGRVEKPQLQAVYERTVRAAKNSGWGEVPSLKTLQRRWNALPADVRTLRREGERALADAYPHAERDRSGMLPLDMLNIDARIWDIRVSVGPNGVAALRIQRVKKVVAPPAERVLRVAVTVLQDVATNYIVGWEIAETESAVVYRRVICGAFAKFGIAKEILFDNTRAAANKGLTAGAKTRFRWAELDTDAPGILKRLNCQPVFALPFNGRSKPVERAFAELKERSEKHPDLAGAYTGRSPSEKPANYGERAVDLETFRALLAQAIDHYNERTDRRSNVAFETSHRALFEEGLKSVQARKLSDKQKRYFFWIAETRKVSASGTFFLGKQPHLNRYGGTEELRNHKNTEIRVFYDPEDFTAPVIAQTLDGDEISDSVHLIERRGFRNQEDAQKYMRAKRRHSKLTKEKAASFEFMTQLEMRTALGSPEPTSEPPQNPVIAADFSRKPTRAPEDTGPDIELVNIAFSKLKLANGF